MKIIDLQQCDVPAVYAQEPKGVSEKYTFIPTTRIVDDLQSLGWHPVRIQGSRKPTAIAGKHVVRLRREGDDLTKVNDVAPELVVLNSHDGLCSFRMQAGLFRLVCSNGLVVAQSVFASIAIRHLRYTYESVTHAVQNYAVRIPEILEHVDHLKSVHFSDERKIRFAEQAIRLRFPDGTAYGQRIDIEQALRPLRREDSENNLWTTFNILQEKVMQGLLVTEGRKKIRKIHSPQRDIELNQAMFSLALEHAAHG
jgi:hypothetical protein